MNIPNFRAWSVNHGVMVDIQSMSFETKIAYYKFLDKIEFEFFDQLILMQSTGLYDVAGYEIFEGDICSHKYYDYPITVTHHQIHGFQFGDVGAVESLKVIGNIHSNPELLVIKND